MSSTVFADQYMATVQAVSDAIEQSRSQNEIVRIICARSAAGIAERLLDACEDWVDAGDEIEFWGADMDGETWRVHLVRSESD